MVNCEYDNILQKDLMQNDKSFSDHKPTVTSIELEKEETQFTVTDIKYAFNKADWDKLNKSIQSSFCHKTRSISPSFIFCTQVMLSKL